MNVRFLIISVVVLLFTACSNKKEGVFSITDNSQYSFNISTDTKVLTEDEQMQLGRLNEFGFSCSKLIADKTFCFSPLSASLLLGILAEGADGQTRNEILGTLGYEGSSTAGLKLLAKDIISLTRSSKNAEFEIANAIFLGKDTEFKKEYLKSTKEYYDAYVSSLDFSAKQSLGIINGWASDKTHGLIYPLLDYIEPELFGYFLSSLYFKAQWSETFSPNLTEDEVFKKSDGTNCTVPMMKKCEYSPFSESEDLQLVRLPYSGEDFVFSIILPKSGNNATNVLEKLNYTVFSDLQENLKSTKVDLWIPKIDFSAKIALNPILEKCGISALFKNPDLSNMCSSFDDHIITLQKTHIKIDENGTEAAAVTYNEDAVDPPFDQPQPDPVLFHADKTFIFIITHKATGAILFIGSYDGKDS